MKIFTEGEETSIKKYVGEFIIVLGKRGSGKSNTLTVVAEELLKENVNMSVLDLEDEFGALIKEKAISDSKADVKKLAHDAIVNNKPVRLDISDMNEDEMEKFLADYLNALWDIEKEQKVPHCIMIDELWSFAPQSGKKTELAHIFQKIALRGRKYGLFVLGASQRSANISKDVITQAGIYFLTKVTHPADLKIYKEIIGDKNVIGEVPKLNVGECIYIEGDNKLKRKVRLAEVELGGKTPSMDRVKPLGESHTPKKQDKKIKVKDKKDIISIVLGIIFIIIIIASFLKIGFLGIIILIILGIIWWNVYSRKKD